MIPILACGTIRITPAGWVLIYSVLGAWAISIVLLFVNLAFMFGLGQKARVANLVLFGFYSSSTTGLFFCGYMGISASILPLAVVAIPPLIIGHFLYLFWFRKKIRRAEGAYLDPC